ncbi:MAG: hypothetical protein QW772_01475 [Zestosphaera sp.]
MFLTRSSDSFNLRGDDIYNALVVEGFRMVKCVSGEYYDESGGFHGIPYYTATDCLCGFYDWGYVCVKGSDLEITDYLSELDLYLYAKSFPGVLIDRVANTAGDESVEYLGFELVDKFGGERGLNIVLDHNLTPIDHHFILSCRLWDVIECVRSVNSWIYDLLGLISEEGEAILSRCSPQDLELVSCSICGAIMKKYLYNQHVKGHETKETAEELELLQGLLRMVEEPPTLEEIIENFPKAIGRHRDEVLKLLRDKWLSSRHADAVANNVNKHLERMGEAVGLHNIGKLVEMCRLLLREVPDYALDEFIMRKTVLPSMLSEAAVKELTMRLKTRESEDYDEDFHCI